MFGTASHGGLLCKISHLHSLRGGKKKTLLLKNPDLRTKPATVKYVVNSDQTNKTTGGREDGNEKDAPTAVVNLPNCTDSSKSLSEAQ